MLTAAMKNMPQLDILRNLSAEIRDVDVGHQVDRVHISQLSPMAFVQQYVARNKPVIIQGAFDSWPALRKWDAAYLCDKAGDTVITVDVTPNGRGDAVTRVTRCVPAQAGEHSGSAGSATAPSTAAAAAAVPSDAAHACSAHAKTLSVGAAGVVAAAVAGTAEAGSSGTRAWSKCGTPPCCDSHLPQPECTPAAAAAAPSCTPHQQEEEGQHTHHAAGSAPEASPKAKKTDPEEHEVARAGSAAAATAVATADAAAGSQPSSSSGLQVAVVGQQEGEGGSPPRWFITPCELRMNLTQFFQLFRESRDTRGDTRVVPYYQHQNSSLTGEFPFLMSDIQPYFGWADEVFGPPEATNLWIGDERSVTSFHKDHFENLYAVVRGTKVFHLLPPSDVYRMALRKYPAAQYVAVPPLHPESNTHTNANQATSTVAAAGAAAAAAGEARGCNNIQSGTYGGLQLGATQLVPQLKAPAHEVSWTDVEPAGCEEYGASRADPEHALFHDPELSKCMVAEVGPGELLYLPAIWYHRVSQVCTQADQGHDYVLAVNYWYDMPFDARWAYFRAVEALSIQMGLTQVVE